MRYIVDSNNRVLAVNFGSIIHYTDCDCSEYTGRVPSGWNSLEEWHDDEGEKLWRWKIVGGNLTLDSSAKAPEEGRWGVPKLQDKRVTGSILTQTLIKADAGYDGLRAVVIDAQVGWKKAQTTTFQGNQVLAISGAQVEGRYPKAILLNFVGDVNLLSQNLISMALIQMSDGTVTSCAVTASMGNGSFYCLQGTSLLGVSSIGSEGSILVSKPTVSEAFYHSAQSMYECYLMY